MVIMNDFLESVDTPKRRHAYNTFRYYAAMDTPLLGPFYIRNTLLTPSLQLDTIHVAYTTYADLSPLR